MTALLARLPRIDPPKYFPRRGEDRCHHDMLIFSGRSTCALCLGLPEFPDLEAVFVDGVIADLPMTWDVVVERHIDCVKCGHPLPLGRRAVYTVAEGGVVGECCEAAA